MRVYAVHSYRNSLPAGSASFVVREAEGADACDVVDYKRQVYTETDLLLVSQEDEELTEDNERTLIRRFAVSPTSLALLAVDGGRILGQGVITGGYYRRTRHVGQIGLSVRADSWGRGVGRALLEESLRWAESNRHLRRLALQVYESNTRARALYEQYGFGVEGRLRNEVRRDSGQFEDLMVMGKWLESDSASGPATSA